MVDDLTEAARSVGLEVNANKTNWMSTNSTGQTLMVNGVELGLVQSLVYLGQIIHLPRDHGAEVNRRVSSAWNVYRKVRSLMRSRMTPMATKRKSWHVCVLPAFLYGSEAWALTKSSETKLVRCQRRMERHMLCHRLVDRVPNATIRDRTKLKDVIQEARKRKWKFAKKIVEGDQERWEARLLNWKPDTKRPLGRPRTRRRLQELLQV